MGDVELRQVRALVAIAEEGTFSRAAVRLGYTQSTVSQQVSALERAVGGPVFDRPGGPTPARLTPLGQLVLERGRTLLAAEAALTDAVERFRSGAGRVDIGTFQSVSAVILPGLVRRLQVEQPECEIRLFEGELDDPQIGELDLLFHDAPVTGDVHSRKLMDDRYVLVAEPDRFPRGPVPLPLLHGQPMVAWPAVCAQPQLERALDRAGCRPQVVFRSANNETLLALVRSGLGFAILPTLAVAGARIDDDPQLSIHELDHPITRAVYLHWPAHRTLSPLAARALAVTRELAGTRTAG